MINLRVLIQATREAIKAQNINPNGVYHKDIAPFTYVQFNFKKSEQCRSIEMVLTSPVCPSGLMWQLSETEENPGEWSRYFYLSGGTIIKKHQREKMTATGWKLSVEALTTLWSQTNQ